MPDPRERRSVDERLTIVIVLLAATGLLVAGAVNVLSYRVGFGAYLATLGLVLLAFGAVAYKRGIPTGRPTGWELKGRIVLGVFALALALVFYLAGK
jgi:hypothetical protein